MTPKTILIYTFTCKKTKKDFIISAIRLHYALKEARKNIKGSFKYTFTVLCYCSEIYLLKFFEGLESKKLKFNKLTDVLIRHKSVLLS